MDAPLTIRWALPSDLPQLLALNRHLDPDDHIPPLDVAEWRYAALQAYHGSAIFVGIAENAIVVSCTFPTSPAAVSPMG